MFGNSFETSFETFGNFSQTYFFAFSLFSSSSLPNLLNLSTIVLPKSSIPFLTIPFSIKSKDLLSAIFLLFRYSIVSSTSLFSPFSLESFSNIFIDSSTVVSIFCLSDIILFLRESKLLLIPDILPIIFLALLSPSFSLLISSDNFTKKSISLFTFFIIPSTSLIESINLMFSTILVTPFKFCCGNKYSNSPNLLLFSLSVITLLSFVFASFMFCCCGSM